MPIVNTNDAPEVEASLMAILESTDDEGRIDAIRSLFVEVLDYEQDNRPIALNASSDYLPTDARLVAHRDGVYAVYMPFGGSRVTGQAATEAARSLSRVLGDDLLMLFTNGDCDQFHIIHPDFSGSRPTLNRMVVRKDERHRTIAQQIAGMWEAYGRQGKTIHEAIRAAFSVEPVTREFFRAYKDIFKDAESKIAGFGNDADGVEDKHRFTQMLFNRLMFIYFVSRKGWLTFHGDPDYLNALWKAYNSTPGNVNFYDARLVPLFFEGLNNPKAPDLIRDDPELYAAIGDVKFLNGGLFEKSELDKRSGIEVQDDAIEPILSRLFDRFNFTVMESTPYDTEVAVDPEMLGKVFEELVTGRHESGAYYTPRPVVAFMCREALKGYLAGQATGLTEDVITAFVDSQNTAGVSVPDARKVASALEQVTVVDPACGSGAYLLGMMQELIELQTILFNVVADSKSIYDLKLEIIQRNLYGVDIDEFAVNIAMLRLWLSLAIDYDGSDPEPLPNLGFKIACGDSLLGPDPSSQNYGNMFRNFVQDLNLGEMKAEYMRATELADKERWRTEITAAREQIESTLGDAGVQGNAIDWRVEFAEVLGERGGFDIVVANPPYGITTNDRRSKEIGNTDSYTNFMALAGEIAPDGVMSYITPTSWETGERFKKFRQFLFGKMAVQSVVNLPYDVFETPYVDTAITTGTYGRELPALAFGLATLEKRAELDLTQIVDYMTSVEWAVVAGDANLRVPLVGWAASLFSRITAKSTPLGEMTSSKRGIAEYKFNILRRQTPDALPFFSGQVQRYEVGGSSASNFVVVSGREAYFHRGLRILARRLVSRSNRLSFARTNDNLVVKEALLPIKPKFDDSTKLAGLLAILNSSLMSFLYLSRSTAATKDDFRQVTLAGLRELPIIFPDSTAVEELVQLVLARERQEGNIEELEKQIDELIYQVYGVTDDEQDAIVAWLARSG